MTKFNAFQTKKGDRVNVNYYGHTSAGTVTSCRSHTMNWKKMVIFVELEDATHWGDCGVCVEVYEDGSDHNPGGCAISWRS